LKQGKFDAAKQMIDAAGAAGDVPTISLLGRLHLTGKIYDKDEGKAKELLEIAVSRGNVVAKGLLGRVLLRSPMGSRVWFRGLRMFLAAFPSVLVVACTEGIGSDRLR
jgi:TPR repeat protein